MNAEKFRNIERIYHEAIELPEADRRFFLDAACAGNPELLAEVESLIALDRTSDGFLETSPQQLVAELMPEFADPPDLVGTSVGHFKIKELIGKGGMGEVYLAEDTKLDRKVALKFLPPEFVANEDRMNRFIREAKAVSALNHPNIITIYEINEVAGRHFIANEYIDGKTLRQLADGHPVEAVRALEIAIQIASALDEAHSAGIAHRDIKPDNIMIRQNGLVKILDFGIAKIANESAGARVDDPGPDSPVSATRAGIIVGTADYMSPEQARGVEVDTRTDLFSFGIVLFEMLEGRLPFSGATPLETIDSILHEKPVELSSETPEIRLIVDRCLRKEAAERYQSAEELLADLRSARRAVDHRRPRPTSEVVQRAASVVEAGPTGDNLSAPSSTLKTRRAAAGAKWMALALMLASVAGFFGYRYYGQHRRISSVAVMPFANEAGNKDIEYLSDGMTETLISNLSNVPNLSIKARSSVFNYKGKNVDPGTVGRELKVDALLYGRLTQTGDRLSLGLELVDAATGDILWTESFERRLNDLAAFQVEIASEVSKKLRDKLTEAQQNQVAKVYTSNSEAQQLYLKGRFHWNKRNVRDFQRATGYFELAAEKDPEYALAFAGLADTLALMPLYGDFRPHEYMPRARQAAQRALELDPNLAEAHASLGYILGSFDYDTSGAEREFKLAIKLNPNYATAHQWYAEFLAFRGNHAAALAEISKAIELDPLSLTINRMKGNILGFAGRHDEAIAQLEKTNELYPESALVRFNLGDEYAAKGLRSEAVGAYIDALKLSGEDARRIERLRDANRRRGWAGFWREYLGQLEQSRNELVRRNPSAYVDEESLAFAHAMNLNRERTLESLSRAFEARNPTLVTIGVSSSYDFLRDDPQFQTLIGNIGLPK